MRSRFNHVADADALLPSGRCGAWRVLGQSGSGDNPFWFTADTHFGDAEAIARFKRPFKDVADMDEGLIAAWNAVVSVEDEVWHLGDFAVNATHERASGLLARLNGRKHLIAGNNDGPVIINAPEWESVSPYREIELAGTRLFLCHYPFRAWGGRYDLAYNIHGHMHGELAPLPRQIDVGVDVCGFRPVPLSRIFASQLD